MQSGEDLMRKMETLKGELEEVKAKQSRLAGEIQAREQQLKELEDGCQKDFGVSLDELAPLLETKKAKVVEMQNELAKVLGVE